MISEPKSETSGEVNDVKMRKRKICCFREMYVERVHYAEEELRDSIATALPEHLDRAHEFNHLLNVSKNLNKIIPSTMTEQLYESKCKKFERKVEDPWNDLMLTYGYMTPLSKYNKNR